MKNTIAKKTPAALLADQLRPGLPAGFKCSECMMVNMMDPTGSAPEFVMICPTTEIYRQCRRTKTLANLRGDVRTLYDQMKAHKNPSWHTISLNGSTIYLRPNE